MKKACIVALYGKTRKATGFKSLPVNCWDINQVTLKCQQIFWIHLQEKVSNRKSERNHQTLHIWEGPGTTFYA